MGCCDCGVPGRGRQRGERCLAARASLPGTIFREASGDGCDFYHRYPDDVATVAALGLNAFGVFFTATDETGLGVIA